MIAFMLALAAVQATPAAPIASDRGCAVLVKSDPEQALGAANAWRLNGGGLAARQCIGLAYVALERWAPGAEVFTLAAQEADGARDPRGADLWVQAGNSWLAAGEAVKARAALDNALKAITLAAELRGEVHLDRARAGVAIGDISGARADIDKGLALVPADPFGWYLSAALALKQRDMVRAVKDIDQAVEMAPDDADILLQAGTIAGTAGDIPAAKSFYARAAKAAPASDAGKAAQAALSADAALPPEAADGE